MKSTARIKNHPLHPLLIPFPLAFFTGTFVFDLLGLLNNNAELSRVAWHLQIAGIGMAVLAAVPGILDYINTVPPHSSAKTRAAKHGALNGSNVLLMTLAFFLRPDRDPVPLYILLIEGAGLILMMMAGWLGGTLVYRNQIGVDIRYADAGKWNEEKLAADGDSVVVARADELKVNAMKLVHLEGRRIVIGRTEKGYSAFEDRCPHKGASLAGGAMICGTVQCPWHGSQFDIVTGAVKAGPGKDPIKTYPLREEGGKILLDLAHVGMRS